MVRYHTRSTKKVTNELSFVLPSTKLSPKIRRPKLTPPSKIISCPQSAYIKDCGHGSIFGGGGSIGRQFSGESLKVRKYLKKSSFWHSPVQRCMVPHRMKTCQTVSRIDIVNNALQRWKDCLIPSNRAQHNRPDTMIPLSKESLDMAAYTFSYHMNEGKLTETDPFWGNKSVQESLLR